MSIREKPIGVERSLRPTRVNQNEDVDSFVSFPSPHGEIRVSRDDDGDIWIEQFSKGGRVYIVAPNASATGLAVAILKLQGLPVPGAE